MIERNSFSPPPGIKYTQQQLECVNCGSQTHATCNCGAIYKPKAFERAVQAVTEHPEKSDRALAREIDVSPTTMGKARETTVHAGQLNEPRIGLDNKQRRIPIRPVYTPEPGETDLIDFIIDHFMRLSRQAQTRCAMRIRTIIRGDA